ncbi:MAG: methyltransferase domain-containing protein [Armatimonadetes bacterium]|nr:methyltransferase domain-containing protein [Armatimonadota bacterium]NIM24453.1 methyltransferase domain-containing protein [Armatimonadota bacterium]NIM68324.1 methyltransferase domain-containing protein [Armatimonadota bacterium]NIM76728.1 methyltransferase domain-containing protein [Armatimonadota bacterium]NIN06527.1 methyltransferase domain-containing protein [Armatimonadota bacterium]
MNEDICDQGSSGLERFSSEITALVYDLQFRPDEPDVAFWVNWCREVGGPVLELGCGNGRVSIPLARAGLEVIGIDRSGPMLAVARSRLAGEPAEVQQCLQFIRGDMRDFEPGREVACVIIPAHTFAVLVTHEDQQRALGRIRAALKPGGRLAFDIRLFPNDWLEGTHRLPPVRRVSADGEVDFTEERCLQFDPSSHIITGTSTYTFHRPEGLCRAAESVKGRVLSRQEVEDVLQSAGFVVETVWGDYDRSPFGGDSLKMIFAARRV